MTPEDRHARLASDIKRRRQALDNESLHTSSREMGLRSERVRELSALLEIVERHRAIDPFGINPKDLPRCIECGVEWACETFLSAEKILGGSR
jgi:hypothetical protein